ncbi:recombinase family protein [uncultured Roseobacter sp.]|uniref:recombinase family protein n=1 Tax=uncultured Roseobacter sp. TaxID=114847 RepID=UPI002632B968|nr:recombinase family protein [uncultured Roseobacter sp.]
MSKQRAVIYCRVSSKGQETEGQGLASQETRCRQYAEAKDYAIAAVFPDVVTGGGDFMQRKGMVELLAFLDANKTERFIVVFDDLKRYARDVEFHLKLRREMQARGATPECLNFNFVDSPEGKFSEIIVAASGQLECEQNKRQVEQKTRARMETGFCANKAPVGLRFVHTRDKGNILIPDPPNSDIIREAFEGYASGRFRTQAEVTRFIQRFPDFPGNKNGKVRQHKVTKILTNPIYAGYIRSPAYGIDWLKGQHEPLVALETFEKVQQRRAGSANAPKRANIGDGFALRGVVACAYCKEPLRSSWSTGKYKRYAYYLCQTQDCEMYGKSISRDKVESEVGELLKSMQPRNGLIALATAMFRHAWETRRAQAAEIRAAGQRKIEGLEKEINKTLDRLMSTANDAVIARYEQRVTDLEKEMALAVEGQTQSIEPKGAFEEKLELSLRFLASPWKLWETGPIEVRRLVLKLAFADRLYYFRNQGPRTPEFSFPFKALGVLSGAKCSNGAAGEN